MLLILLHVCVCVLRAGFHEAIGDTIALSVMTPSHLLGISDSLNSNESILQLKENADQLNLNFLMKTALSKVSLLFSVMIGPIMHALYTETWF